MQDRLGKLRGEAGERLAGGQARRQRGRPARRRATCRPVAKAIASAARLLRGGRIGSVSASNLASATISARWPDSSTRQTGRSRATPRMVPDSTLSVPGPPARASFCTRKRPWKAATGTSSPGQARPSWSGPEPCASTGGGVAGSQESPPPGYNRSSRQAAGRDGGMLVCASASPSCASLPSAVSCQTVCAATFRQVPALRTSTAGARSSRGISASAIVKVSVNPSARAGSARVLPGSGKVSGAVSNAFRRPTPSRPSGR